ncbi:MAG: hypothetical protein QT00_C0001G0471 [archaeon GW2011_AR5]|nr:MAG: hypothetical protein QT00_C0001G0471 [archaeon GW2011_AR5]
MIFMNNGFTPRDFIPGAFLYDFRNGMDFAEQSIRKKTEKYETPGPACAYLAWHALWVGTALGFAFVESLK